MSESRKRKNLSSPMSSDECGEIPRDRHLNILIAKEAAKAGRYGDVVKAMETAASVHGAPLLKVETELLELGYNKVIASERSFWRFLKSIVQSAESEGNQTKVDLIKVDMQELVTNIDRVCIRAKAILEDHVIKPKVTDWFHIATHYKMLGDHFRCRAGFKIGEERKDLAKQASDYYEKATRFNNFKKRAEDRLASSYHDLSLDLNRSVHYYEIFDSPDWGHSIAREAIVKATRYMKREIPGGEWDSRSVRLVKILNENIYVAEEIAARRAQGKETVYLKDSLDV